MLRPSYLENLPAPVVSLADELQNEIIDDLVKRIVKGKYNTPSSEWMIYKANQLRLSSAEVNKIIAKSAKVRERLVKELYTDAVKEALSSDAEIYRYAINNGALPQSSAAALKSYFRDIALNNTFKTGLAATNGLMNNLTKSMAAAANRMLSDALDLAWLEVASGAFTPDEACFKAVEKLSANGLKVVNYSSGHNDQVDVAVRRAVRTGINKTCCDMQLELSEDVGCDLVEVTSHFGARPTHAEWQGQIYSLSGKNPKYKDFRSATGFGTGDGLGGWNCRHSFFPYFEGLSLPASSPTFSAEENLEMYENQQQQRAYERAVRRSKRELAGLDAARQSTSDPQLKEKLDKEFTRKSVTLKKREERLSQFCKDKGLMPDNARVRVAGFGRSEAQKAVWAAKKSSQNGLTSGGGSGTINVTTKLTDNNDVLNPMNKDKYLSLKSNLEKNGINVVSATKGSDDEKFLLFMNAEAISDDVGILHLGDVPSASAFYEEMIHCTQIKEYGSMQSDDYIERAAREVAANRMLLENGSIYGFDEQDFIDIQTNLPKWENEFLRLAGVSYDEADIKRDVSYIVGTENSS